MKDTIKIMRNGEPVSQVVFARVIPDFAGIIRAAGRIFMVYDSAVEQYALKISHICHNVCGVYALRNVSEDSKTPGTVEDICRWLLAEGADRKSAVLAVGGGIVSDMAGFAASIYKRGVRSLYLPTTLLAQVDAAIGGKTGVNLDSYKNIIGTFWQPEYTFICPEVLGTLPERVFADGLAEMLKTFIIDNGPGADRVKRMMSAVKAMYAGGTAGGADSVAATSDRDRKTVRKISEDFGALVAEAAAVKAGIVSRDEWEGGERRKLNLGHTFAHAIEYCANSGRQCTISHGEAVAIGLSMAARLSEGLGMARQGVSGAVDECLDICGLPKECPYPAEMLEEAMCKDKKAEDGRVYFILVRDIGDVEEGLLDVPTALEVLSEQCRGGGEGTRNERI